MQTQKYSLTEGVIWKSLLAFAVPIVISNILQQLYNAVDSAVVGSFSTSSALAAVGATGSLINLLVGLFLGVATGAGVIYANYVGAKDIAAMRRTAGSSLCIGVLAGLGLMLLGFWLSPALLRLMNTPEDVLPLAITYLRIYFVGTIPMLLYNIGAALIRSGGDTKRPLWYLALSGLVNLIVDLALVAGLQMGVAGAAWATVLSQLLSAILVLWHLFRLLPEEQRVRRKDLRLHGSTVRLLLRLGIPCGLQSTMFNISNLLVQSKINTFGTLVMAGCTAYTRIDGFVYMPMNAIGLAVSTFMGQNLGAGHQERLKKGVSTGMRICLIATLAIAAVVILSARYLLTLFTDDAQVMDYGLQMMHILAPTCWMYSFAEIYAGAVRGAGAATPAVVISALTICVFRILWLSILLPVWQDVRLVYFCYPASWLLCSVVFLIYYKKGNWIHALARGA